MLFDLIANVILYADERLQKNDFNFRFVFIKVYYNIERINIIYNQRKLNRRLRAISRRPQTKIQSIIEIEYFWFSSAFFALKLCKFSNIKLY